jgi:hypothetical protein
MCHLSEDFPKFNQPNTILSRRAAMAKITYSCEPFGCYLVRIVSKSSSEREEYSTLVQTDWDLPGLATSFGWQPKDDEGNVLRDTDGTIPSEFSNKSAGDFISEARDYLDANEGKKVDDPGYFLEYDRYRR